MLYTIQSKRFEVLMNKSHIELFRVYKKEKCSICNQSVVRKITDNENPLNLCSQFLTVKTCYMPYVYFHVTDIQLAYSAQKCLAELIFCDYLTRDFASAIYMLMRNYSKLYISLQSIILTVSQSQAVLKIFYLGGCNFKRILLSYRRLSE